MPQQSLQPLLAEIFDIFGTFARRPGELLDVSGKTNSLRERHYKSHTTTVNLPVNARTISSGGWRRVLRNC